MIERPTEHGPLVAERPAPLAAPPALRRVAVEPDDMPEPDGWGRLLGEPALTPRELAALAAIARPRSVPQGASIFTQHEQAHSLVFVREGEAALGAVDSSGHFHIERPVRAPGWLDQSSAWLDAKHAVDARALTSVVVVELPRDDVQALLLTQPLLARRLIGSLAREAHTLAIGTHGLMLKDAPARFAGWLLQRCGCPPGGPCHCVIKLTERKRDIASQLAITPETLSRLMRSLSRQGLIAVSGYTVTVMDSEGLRRAAEES